jgi:hypothetical protein
MKNLTNNSSNNAFDDNIRLFQSARSKTMPPSTLDKTVTRKNNKEVYILFITMIFLASSKVRK